MRKVNDINEFSAARIVATLFGVLAGLGGFIHGIGEVLQGNVTPDGIFIPSWVEGPIAAYMGGEPGLTIVPNLLLTGLLTILVSIAMILWSVVFIKRQHGGGVLIALSIALLLVGGGIGPPLIALMAGVAGTGIHAPEEGWRRHLPFTTSPLVARLWPWTFAIAALSGTFLVVGSVILVYFFPQDYADLFLNVFYLTVLFLLFTVLITPAYDRQHIEQGILI